MTMKVMTTIKNQIKPVILAIIGICLFSLNVGCKSEPKIDKATEIAQRAIAAHGGLDNWQKIKTLEFRKVTTLFHADGNVETKSDQKQSFSFQPRNVYKIAYETDSTQVSLIMDNGYVHKRVNGNVVDDEAELKSARSALLAAQYVVKQPFDLLSQSAELSYLGKETVEGRELHVVAVSYLGDDPDADKWSYYIDPETFVVVANKVVLTDHTSWVENLTYDTTTDFKFNAHRKSYRLNDQGEKTYLRAEYFYSDFKVTY